MRLLTACLLLLVSPLFAGDPLPDPNYTMSFTQVVEGVEGESASVLALNLENLTGNGLAGWSTSACSSVPATSIVLGADAAIVNEGGAPEFVAQTIQAAGLEWFVATVVDFQGVEMLVGENTELHLISYEIETGDPLGGDVLFCDIVQGPNMVPVEHTVVEDGNPVLIRPTEVNGVVTFLGAAIFGYINGDCNLDGSITMTDGTDLLNFLFLGAEMPGDCMDACDFQNDGAVDLSDCIGILQFMFLNGIMPAAPFPDCAPPPAIFDCNTVPVCPDP